MAMPTSTTPSAVQPPAPVPTLGPRVIATSVAGTSHLRRSQPCQDAHAWQRADGRLVAAVADGAGSASHSDLGAAAAVVAAVSHLVTALAPAPASSSELDSEPNSGTDSELDSKADPKLVSEDSELDSEDSELDLATTSTAIKPELDSATASKAKAISTSTEESTEESTKESTAESNSTSENLIQHDHRDPSSDSLQSQQDSQQDSQQNSQRDSQQDSQQNSRQEPEQPAPEAGRELGEGTGQRRSPDPQLWVEPSGDATLAAWRSHLLDTLAIAQDAVAMNAAVRGVSPREMACTLIVAIADGERVAIAQIGDGAAVGINPTGELRAFTVPPAAEYANQTHFLTDPQALQQIQLHTWRGSLAGLALFSDGLQRLALQLPAGEPFAPFFDPLFRFVAQVEDEFAGGEQLRTFLQSSRVSERTDDDLTLVLASWSQGSTATPNPEQSQP